MKKPKVDMSGVEAANKAIAAANLAAQNMQKNFSADLKNENIANVTPGGGDEAANPIIQNARRKRSGGGLSSQLGVNV